MGDGLTLEKMKVAEKLESYEKTQDTLVKSVDNLDKSMQEIKGVLFGEKGEKGVVGKLTEMIKLAQTIADVLSWIAKLVLATIILGSLPYITEFISKVTHHG